MNFFENVLIVILLVSMVIVPLLMANIGPQGARNPLSISLRRGLRSTAERRSNRHGKCVTKGYK